MGGGHGLAAGVRRAGAGEGARLATDTRPPPPVTILRSFIETQIMEGKAVGNVVQRAFVLGSRPLILNKWTNPLVKARGGLWEGPRAGVLIFVQGLGGLVLSPSLNPFPLPPPLPPPQFVVDKYARVMLLARHEVACKMTTISQLLADEGLK